MGHQNVSSHGAWNSTIGNVSCWVKALLASEIKTALVIITECELSRRGLCQKHRARYLHTSSSDRSEPRRRLTHEQAGRVVQTTQVAGAGWAASGGLWALLSTLWPWQRAPEAGAPVPAPNVTESGAALRVGPSRVRGLDCTVCFRGKRPRPPNYPSPKFQ